MVTGISFLLLTGLICLGILARAEEGDLFRKIAIYLHKHWSGKGKNLFLQRRYALQREMKRLYPGESLPFRMALFEIEKLRMAVLVLFVGSAFSLVFQIKLACESNMAENGILKRGAVGTGERQVAMHYAVGEVEETVVLTIPPDVYSKEEAQAMLPAFYERLEREMLGKNESLSKVWRDLELPEQISGYPFDLFWISSDPTLLNSYGHIQKEVVQPQQIRLKVKAAYGEDEWEKEYSVILCPPDLTDADGIRQKILAAYQQAVRAADEDGKILLPTQVGDSRIAWKEEKSKVGNYILPGVILAAMLVFFGMDRDLEKKREERQEQMTAFYPLLLHKITLYLGAGMTMRGIFFKLAEEYLQVREEKENPFYEELVVTVNELKAGKTELQAYEELGKRTGLLPYMRLMTLLSQNLKKGNAALVQRLKEESEHARHELQNAQKKKGEELETKLLLPMMLLLLVVMVMVMMPAFSAM